MFLTCGHGWSDGDKVFWKNSSGGNEEIGTVKRRNHSGKTDFSFVELKDQNLSYYTFGYMTDKNVQVTGKINPTTGMSIESYGAKSGIKSESVKATNISGEWSNIQFTDLFSASIPTQEGDSGTAYIYNNSKLVGILKGGLGGYDVSVGIKIMDIVNQFGIQVTY